MATALRTRLAQFLDEDPAADVMAPTAHWRPRMFGDALPDARTIAVHQTAGWPSKIAAANFVARYTTLNYTEDGVDKWGFGPQFYISTDGTTFRLIDMPRITLHATFVNGWSIGVETGRVYRAIGAAVNHSWRALSPDPEDAPGMKLYARTHPGNTPHEVLVVWFTTGTYTGPGRAPVADGEMLFTEGQYRSWALLARFLCEEYLVPRNLPLLPYEKRIENIDNPENFRRIVLADNAFDMILRRLSAFNITAPDFQLANLQALRANYQASVRPAANTTAEHNQAWLRFFDDYRGLHGHGFSGATNRVRNSQGNLVPADHDCPGSLFDWHRFGREISDWWWRAFDFVDGLTSTAAPMRPYRQARRDTLFIEYYFETSEIAYFDRITPGLGQPGFSPETHRLEEGSRIYAMANGEVVAARFPAPTDGVSVAFVLARHEVFHRKIAGRQPAAPNVAFPANAADRIDYDTEPSYVFSLTMHLGRPTGMNFDQVTDANPDWLNRVLLRLKECELGIAFHDTNPAGFPNTAWNSRPPGAAGRPSALEGWRFDHAQSLRRFADDLKAGRIALAPHVSDTWATPVRLILGDFLGVAGRIAAPGGTTDIHGIRLEVFSKELISADDFSAVTTATNWTVPDGLPNPPALKYQSEWSIVPAPITVDLLNLLHIEPNLVNWWQEVAAHTLSDTLLPVEARLPWDGNVWHYRPRDFLRWINITTWRSEWPKYRVTDATNNTPVLAPPVPRNRRIT